MKVLPMAALSTLLSFSAFASEIGKLVVVRGAVEIVTAGGESIEPKPLGSLHEGHKIVTGERGYVKLLMNDDSVFQVGPNSEFAFEKYQQETKQKRTAVYNLAKGQLRSWFVHKAPEKTLTIKTPTAAMGIRGTEILTDVYHNEEGEVRTDIALIRGKLEVDSKALGDSVVMEPGQLLDGLGERLAARAPASARAALLKQLPTKVFEAVRKNSIDQSGSIFLNEARQKFGDEGSAPVKKIFSNSNLQKKSGERAPASSLVDGKEFSIKRNQARKNIKQRIQRRRERNISAGKRGDSNTDRKPASNSSTGRPGKGKGPAWNAVDTSN